jgi:hypothetical protein
MREKTNNNWRNKAEEAFAFALRLSDHQARRAMLTIACSYVSLSQRAEKLAAEGYSDVESNPALVTAPIEEDHGSPE